MRREPQRTCIGCRRVQARTLLIRLVRGRDGIVAVDRGGTKPGRGAYVCPRPECVAGALRRGRLARAFRANTEPPADLAARLLGGAGSGT